MEHRIILINFPDREVEAVANAGYTVELGYIGKMSEDKKDCSFYAPHPLYEYDVLFYNSDIPEELTDYEFPDSTNLLKDEGALNALHSLRVPPYVRVSFIGCNVGAEDLVFGGLPFIKLEDADANVSSLIEPWRATFSIPELHEVLTRFKSRVDEVGQFYFSEKDLYPLYNISVFNTRSGKQVAGYGTSYGDSQTKLHYVVLPQVVDRHRAIIEILKCLENIHPELFPDIVKRDWLDTDEFLLPEEKAIDEDIREKMKETDIFIERKKRERKELATENGFVRNLLTSREDHDLPLELRLSGVVKKAFEMLGFKVIDIDQQIKSAIKKEDFWVIDGDFLAITEVTGTVNKNPKVKEFNDVFARLATIYKRKGELVLPSSANVSGLLVLNYDIDNHPSKCRGFIRAATNTSSKLRWSKALGCCLPENCTRSSWQLERAYLQRSRPGRS